MKIKKSIFTLGLALSLAATSVVSPLGSQLSGSITAEAASKSISISTVAELKDFAAKVNAGNTYKGYTITLKKDLKFDGTPDNFTPIGSNSDGFQGTFNGNNHTISGIDSSGLFYDVNGGTVKNLYVENCTFTADSGLLGGIARTLKDGTINNCHVIKCTLTQKNINMSRTGGIAGTVVGGTIVNCSNASTITETGDGDNIRCGGIAGWVWNGGEINNSCNVGKINSAQAGGIAGLIEDSKVQNSFNAGNVTFGIAKETNLNTTLYQCYSVKGANDFQVKIPKGTTKDCATYTDLYMKSDDFQKKLNKNSVKSSWRKWEFRTSVSSYPLPAKALSKQTLTLKVSSKTYKVSQVKSSKQTFSIGGSAKTSVSYKVLDGKDYISVTSKGKVTVKKYTPKGTYRIQVTAKETGKYKKVTKTVNVSVK